jgi:type IV pilus assembly protein PilC
MKFLYQARTREGDLKSGVIEASSREVALNLLQKMGLFVTYLEEERAPIYARELKIFQRVSIRDLILFTNQLSVMVASRIPIVEALKTLAVQTSNPSLREIIFEVSEEVEGGNSLSKALSRYPKVFSPFFIAVIEVGEKVGKLSNSLNYLFNHLEREYFISSKVRGAFIYPAFVLLLFSLIFTFMIFSVFPNLERIFIERGEKVPTLILLSNFLRENFIFLISIIFISISLLFYYSRTKNGKKNIERVLLKLPIFGQILKYSLLARFSENLATLTSAGIMVTEALEAIEGIIGNEIYREIISQMKEEVKKGSSVSSILALYPEYFPPFFVQMVKVGERTGSFGENLMTASNFLKGEVERRVENFARILEPVLIIFLGLLVGGLLVSVISPLYKIIGGY